jgi:hypothetical protein
MDENKITHNENENAYQKWLISIILGMLFLILISPIAFRFSNSIFSFVRFPLTSRAGVPNIRGLVVHTVVFIILVRILMK